jgi:hypothetical protein
MQIKTFEDYRAARAELDAKNEAIDRALGSRVPVFAGIVELHAAVTRYEREHKICNVETVN